MTNVVVVIKLIINQSDKQFSAFLWDRFGKCAVFFSSRVVTQGDLM